MNYFMMKRNNLKYIDDFTKKEYEEISQEDYFLNKELSVTEVENGIILPVLNTNKYNTSKGAGGVIDKELNYIESSAQLAYNMKNRVYGKYDIENEKIEYDNETVIYGNFFYKHWGHFIIDIVSRLWYLLEDNSENKAKIVFTTMINDEKTKIDGNYKEFLNLFGISDDRILLINKPTKFKKIIIPECSIYPGKYYTKEYIKIFEKVRDSVKGNQNIPEKIYLSRSKFKKAKEKEIGEKEIEKFFNNNGYYSISPEQLTLTEQVQFFTDSREIVCISGTLPHNIMFANEGKDIIIINKTYKLNKHQEIINQAKKANVTYLDLHISLFPVAYGKGPFIMTINKNLQRFAKDRTYNLEIIITQKIKNIYKKVWYLIQYLKIYKFKIYDDGKTNWKELFKFYILK